MESRKEPNARADDLTPTPTQAENDAAMIAATGGEGAAGPPDAPDPPAERKPAVPAAHEPERRPSR